jgi:membrane protein YdbS with pleckstrin-like domain
MQKIKKLLAIVLFLLQIMISLLLYAYAAYRWSLAMPVAVAVAGTFMAMLIFDKLFKSPGLKKSVIKKAPGGKAGIRIISKRKKVTV